MAVFGKLKSLENLFKKTQAIQNLYSYLFEAQNHNSSIFKRILQTQGENKIPLGDGMFAIEQSYCLKDRDFAIFETHTQYVDFQLVIQHQELFLIGDKTDFKESAHYHDRDVINYHQDFEKTSKLLLQAGMLAIFFDYDVHAGGIITNNYQDRVFKTVVKVPKELLKLKL